MKPLLALVGICLLSVACGSSSSTTAPSTTPQANRPPSITSANVTPASGVTTLSTHSFTASATDPDGDAVTYKWDFGNGTTSNNASASVMFNNASTTTYQATLTATDSRGASSSTTVSITSVSMTGTWAGTLVTPITAVMTQYLGGIVTGTWQQPARSAQGEIGPAGEPGTIQASGQFELRFKVRVGSFTDFYYRGTVDPTGQRLTGTLQGSGFAGNTLVLTKQ
jgi:hypothetical protein